MVKNFHQKKLQFTTKLLYLKELVLPFGFLSLTFASEYIAGWARIFCHCHYDNSVILAFTFTVLHCYYAIIKIIGAFYC